MEVASSRTSAGPPGTARVCMSPSARRRTIMVMPCSGPLTQCRPAATAITGSMRPRARMAAVQARPTPRVRSLLAASTSPCAARSRRRPSACLLNAPALAAALR